MNRHEKLRFLEKRGLSADGLSKKGINKLIEQELEGYRTFDLQDWVIDYFKQSPHLWDKLYEDVKVKKQKAYFEANVLRKSMLDSLMQARMKLYISLRADVAKHLAFELDGIPKAKLHGAKTLVDLFYLEIERSPGEWILEDFELEAFIGRLTYEKIIPGIQNDLSDELKRQYELLSGDKISRHLIWQLIGTRIEELEWEFQEELEQEQVSELLEVAVTPFQYEAHYRLYHEQAERRERKRAEELAEQKRLEEEKNRQLEDIFGREYRTSIYQNTRYVLHIGETNTGKTYQALKRMKAAPTGIYLAPLRLLALEVYESLRNEGISCALKTGEEEKNIDDATHFSCTVEMFHEKDAYDVMVIDEAQMIADKDRGFSWYRAIQKARAKEVHIIGSHSAKKMLMNMLEGNDVELHEYSRQVPLKVEKKPFSFSNVKQGDALIVFSRAKVLQTASRLERDGHKVSIIYGSMPPETRAKQMKRFIDKESKVIVSTDAIGMGLNLPIRRVVFLENEKFDGTRRRMLTSQEVKQLAGRAGRKGLYNVGLVAFTSQIDVMTRLLEEDDQSISTFTIAPTQQVFDRFARYHSSLEHFFYLWGEFKNPHGTKKAPLTQERELYEHIRNTEIERRFSASDLYGFLHLPFSSNEPALVRQWMANMKAVMNNSDLPEPIVKRDTLDELELSYKSIGLHLLFLYRLDRRTEAYYWERIREEISARAHSKLRTDVKKYQKKCRSCGKQLPSEYPYNICQSCYDDRILSKYHYRRRDY
ncbi:RNA helicase [Pradoshia eiseniae]|uniref:RNA helicase n=2 Tax=Pradoshia eiseniae TaxID=2064768 RepID=A0A2S7MXB3_9BACI|nr:RNA helicase [Pradoshia eiseniae]